MTLLDRIANYHTATGFPESLFLGGDGRIAGVWIMGNDYRVKSTYYGGFPAGYLRRVAALFPDRRKVLHLFSGKVDTDTFPGDTVDLNADNVPTFVDDAQTLVNVPLEEYDFVLADPPYSVEDADHYQTSMVKRNKVLDTLGKRLRPGAFVVWLDQVLPMYRKADFSVVGHIGMVKSTNHRFRVVTIFLKNNLTDKQLSVNLSSPARDGQTTNPNITVNDMNSKQLALISGVLACAFGQIKNILSGKTTEACDTPAPAKSKSKPKPVEEDDDDTAADDEDITVNVEEDKEDDPDYDALRKQALSLVGKLFKADVANKKKIKAILEGLGESTVGDMEEENLPKFIAKAKKIAV